MLKINFDSFVVSYLKFQATDFYDEIEIADFDVDEKDHHHHHRSAAGYVVPDGDIDLENCHLDLVASHHHHHHHGQMAKKPRMETGSNRRKMPLVNRIL